MRVRMNERTGSCKRVPCLLRFPGKSQPPANSNGPEEPQGGRGIPGGVRTCVSALIRTHHWETHTDIGHEGHLSNFEQRKRDGPNNVNQVQQKRERDRSAFSFDLVATQRFLWNGHDSLQRWSGAILEPEVRCKAEASLVRAYLHPGATPQKLSQGS